MEHSVVSFPNSNDCSDNYPATNATQRTRAMRKLVIREAQAIARNTAVCAQCPAPAVSMVPAMREFGVDVLLHN
jgi:hypothetical protein